MTRLYYKEIMHVWQKFEFIKVVTVYHDLHNFSVREKIVFDSRNFD